MRKNSPEVLPNSRLYKPPDPRGAKSPNGKSPNDSPQRLKQQPPSPMRSVNKGPLRFNNNTWTEKAFANPKTPLVKKQSQSPQSFITTNQLPTRSQKSPQRYNMQTFRTAPSNVPKLPSSAPAPSATRRPDWLINTPSRLACDIFMGLGDKKKRNGKQFSVSPHRDISQGSFRLKSANKSAKGYSNVKYTESKLNCKRPPSRNFRSKAIKRNRSVSSKRYSDEIKRVDSPFVERRLSKIQLYNQTKTLEPRCVTPAVRIKSKREKELKEGRLVIVKRGKQGKVNSSEVIANHKDEPETAINSRQEVATERENFLIENDDSEILILKTESRLKERNNHKKRSHKHKVHRETHDKEVDKNKDKNYENKKMSNDHSAANDISDPSECLAEFLSAIMQRRYEDAHRYCKLILRYEPDNVTAKEFYPLLAEKLKLKDASKRDDTKSPERTANDDDSQLNLNTDKEDNSYETSEVSSVIDEEWSIDPDYPEKSNSRTNSDSGGEVDTDNNPATDVEDFSDDNGNVVAVAEKAKEKANNRVNNDKNALILSTPGINYQCGDSKVPDKSDYESVENVRKLRARFLKA